MNHSTFTTIRTARTAIEADLLMSALRCEDLHPLELNTFGHFSLAGTDISYEIRVPSEEAEKAREVLDTVVSTSANSQEAL
jgi:hypothetical protein